MISAVRVNTATYATTHVATNMLRSLRQIVTEAGLDSGWFLTHWETLERGVDTWLGSHHLESLVLEVYDPTNSATNDLVGRFDFDIIYDYYSDGEGELWLDPATVSYAVKKSGSYPSRCRYRIVATRAPGAPKVEGWTDTELRSATAFTKHSIGAAIGGGSLGTSLGYYAKSGR